LFTLTNAFDKSFAQSFAVFLILVELYQGCTIMQAFPTTIEPTTTLATTTPSMQC